MWLVPKKNQPPHFESSVSDPEYYKYITLIASSMNMEADLYQTLYSAIKKQISCVYTLADLESCGTKSSMISSITYKLCNWENRGRYVNGYSNIEDE